MLHRRCAHLRVEHCNPSQYWPLVVSIGTQPESFFFFFFLSGPIHLAFQAAWTQYEVLCSSQGHTSVGGSEEAHAAARAHIFWFSAPENVCTSQRSPSAESKEWDDLTFVWSECESVPVFDEKKQNSGGFTTLVGIFLCSFSPSKFKSQLINLLIQTFLNIWLLISLCEPNQTFYHRDLDRWMLFSLRANGCSLCWFIPQT